MANQETLDTIEKTLDVIEDQLDVIEKVKPGSFNLNGTTKAQQITVVVVTAVVSAAVAGVVTHHFTKKHLKAKYEEVISQELEDAKKFYSRLHKTDEYSDPVKLAEKYEDDPDSEMVSEAVEAIQRYSPSEVEKPVETEEALIIEEKTETVVRKNIFTEAQADGDGFKLEEEMKNRRPDRPYVISYDEFFENEPEFEEMSLTYFEGDDVLVDDRDQHIDDTEGLVGNANLLRFGHGSKDKNVVYIRNERLQLNIEVMHSHGKFTETVLGFIEHSSDSGRNRRFRRDDDG